MKELWHRLEVPKVRLVLASATSERPCYITAGLDVQGFEVR